MENDFVPLVTERLKLRPLQADDAAALHRLVNDWEVAKTLARVPFPYPRDLADEWIASTRAQISAGTAWHFRDLGWAWDCGQAHRAYPDRGAITHCDQIGQSNLWRL